MSIEKLLNPRSVAIVGASDRIGPGFNAWKALEHVGFAGKVHLVNPSKPELLGQACHPSLAAIEDEVTVPRPARLPSGMGHAESSEQTRDVPTVVPTAMDLVVPNAPRRRGELAVVAVLAFGLAWFARSGSETPAPAPAAAPVPTAMARVAEAPCTPDASPSIPTVALADLPVLGAASVAAAAMSAKFSMPAVFSSPRRTTSRSSGSFFARNSPGRAASISGARSRSICR